MLLCPHCLQPGEMTEVDDPERGKSLRCSNPECADYPIPLLYADDYASHPPLPVSIIGLSGHGKTVFIESLIQEIHQLGARWPNSGFYFTWLDEVQMRAASKRIRDLREGRLPKATRTVFQQPQVLRLSNIPCVGGSQLVIFDTGGEVFLDASTLTDAGRYVKNSTAALWLLSLKAGDPYDSPEDVNQMMTVYLQAMARMGGQTRNQTLILVLTKGDELLSRPDLPASARDLLATADFSPAGPVWGTLDAASHDLEAWLKSPHCGYHNLVHLVRSRFKAVRYCIVSAQGAPSQGDALKFGLMPRGVLAPLLWLWRLDRAPVTVAVKGRQSLFLDLGTGIEQAAGGVVQLEDRVYRVEGAVTIRNPLTLIGQGSGKTVLELSGPGFGFGIGVEGSGKVLMRGITLKRVGPTPGDGIRVLQGELQLEDCTITGASSGTVEGREVKGQGVLVAKNSRFTATNSRFQDNHGNGILIIDKGQAALTACEMEGNRDGGLFARTTGVVTVQNCTLKSNLSGIWIEAAGAAMIEANTCEQNGNSGIVLSGQVGSGVIVQGNQCRYNGRDGIQSRARATPTVIRNTCSGNRRNGVSFTDQTAGTGRENLCIGNIRNGLRVSDQAAPELEGNTAESNQESGLLFEDRGAGVARKNYTLGNRGDGIRLEGAGTPLLEANESRRNEGYGLAITGAGSTVPVDPRGNMLTDNRKGAVTDLRTKKTGGWWK